MNVDLTAVGKSAGKIIGVVSLCLGVAACSSPQGLNDINDPFEAANRKTHALNKALDRTVLRPAARAYDAVVPDPVTIAIGNFSNFMDIPAEVVNNLLQLDLNGAAINTARFTVNGTLGIAGLYDAAAEMGLDGVSADFGQTLDKWGFGEGAYLELPLKGPSTERDAVGLFVDTVFNPMTMVLPQRFKFSGTGVKALAKIADRARFASSVESVLYDSADSYAQARLFYLQSRRHELGMTQDETDYFDPYEDLYE